LVTNQGKDCRPQLEKSQSGMSNAHDLIDKVIFRQRVGKLNWQQLSTCSLRAVVEKRSIDQLQKVLDNLTFSEFSADDVKSQSAESISKLVNTMQLIIEYQLQCQDVQMNVLKAKNEEMKELKKEKIKLETERVSLHEDRRIYQRQLKLLRQSLSKAQDMIKYPENIQSMILGSTARVVFDPLSLSPKREQPALVPTTNNLSSPKSVMEDIYPLVDVVVRGQQESGDAMREIVVEQRRAMKEMMKMILDQQAAMNARKEEQYGPDHTSGPRTPAPTPMSVPVMMRTAEVQTSIELKPTQSPKQKGYLQSILMEAADSEAQETRWAEIRRKEAEISRTEAVLIHRERTVMEKERSLEEQAKELVALRKAAAIAEKDRIQEVKLQPQASDNTEKSVSQAGLKKRAVKYLALAFSLGM